MSATLRCIWCGGPNHGSWMPLQHRHRLVCIDCAAWLLRDVPVGLGTRDGLVAAPRPAPEHRGP